MGECVRAYLYWHARALLSCTLVPAFSHDHSTSYCHTPVLSTHPVVYRVTTTIPLRCDARTLTTRIVLKRSTFLDSAHNFI